MLSVLSAYIPEIPPVSVDGIYGPATRAAVLAAQRRFRLPETGTVGATTWDEIYDQYSGIENISFRNGGTFTRSTPSTGNQVQAVGNFRRNGTTQLTNRTNYARTTTLTQFPGRDLSMGGQDPVRQEVVR